MTAGRGEAGALMKRFYTDLHQGQTRDEALRAAQPDLICSEKSEISYSYLGAGFALDGDWRQRQAPFATGGPPVPRSAR